MIVFFLALFAVKPWLIFIRVPEGENKMAAEDF